jgi:hypothetical protein
MPNIGDDGLTHLVSVFTHRQIISRLSITGLHPNIFLSPITLKQLCDALGSNRVFSALKFERVSNFRNIGDCVVQVLNNPSVHSLTLESCFLSESAFSQVCQAIQSSKHLETFKFSQVNQYGNWSSWKIASESLWNSSLRTLNIQVDWRPTLAGDPIIRSSLVELRFTSIVISQQCSFLNDLAIFLKDNMILKKLELGIMSSPELVAFRLLSDEMKLALESDLSLEWLSLNSSQLNHEEFEWISEWLPGNTSLLSLNLGRTKMDDDNLLKISEGLKLNSSIESLDVSSNAYSIPKGFEALGSVLSCNSSLTSLEMNWRFGEFTPEEEVLFENIRMSNSLLYFYGGPDPCELDFPINRKKFYWDLRLCLVHFAKSISPSVELNLLKLVFEFYSVLEV